MLLIGQSLMMFIYVHEVEGAEILKQVVSGMICPSEGSLNVLSRRRRGQRRNKITMGMSYFKFAIASSAYLNRGDFLSGRFPSLVFFCFRSRHSGAYPLDP